MVLSLDPIDGTMLYASGKEFFSVIVYLTDGKSPVYTFYYYPMFDWVHKIIKDKVEDSLSVLPRGKIKEGVDLSKTIIRTSGDPEKMMPEVYSELIKKGYKFCKLSEISIDSTSSVLLFGGQSAGYYTENPNAYDGLGALHFGLAKKLKVYSNINFSVLKTRETGKYYEGSYLVLSK